MSELLHSAKTAGSPGTDKTDLTTCRSVRGHRGRTTDVLVVTTSERVLHWVLRHTPNLGPAVAFDGVLVVGAPGLKERLVRASASGNDSDLRPGVGGHGFLPSRGKSKAGCLGLLVVGDDHGEAAGSASEGAAVSRFAFDVADDGALRHGLEWEDVADGQIGLLSAVHELTGVHPLGCEHELRIALEFVGIQELDLGHGGTTTGVMQNFFHDPANVASAFRVVDGAELDGALAGAHVGFEDGGLALSLCLLHEGAIGVHRANHNDWILDPMRWGCIIHRPRERVTEMASHHRIGSPAVETIDVAEEHRRIEDHNFDSVRDSRMDGL